MFFIERADLVVVISYLALTLFIGFWVSRGSQTAEGYTVGDRRVPGWLMSFAMFATFVSSITFLGQPSQAYKGTWNFLLFTFTLPPAAWVASAFFVPLYRRGNRLSAYELLEDHFGYWARLFANICFIFHQLLRIASISVFMAMAVGPMLNLPIIPTLLVVSGVVIAYDVLGGIKAVIWTDFLQSFVLAGGAIWCLVTLLSNVPGGVARIVEVANADNKFVLSDTPWYGLAGQTAMVMILYGIVDNLRNFGVDQNYVQKMLATRSDRAASGSIWFSAILYAPTTFLFLSIGTSLYVYYDHLEHLPADAPEKKWALPAGMPADQVFPHFITTELPKPIAGLVISALLAAGMSTIDSNLNSISTVVLVDVFRRFHLRPRWLSEIVLLRLTTILFGCLATAVAVPLTTLSDRTLFDRWLGYAGMAGFPLLAIFLMAWLFPRITSPAAFISALAGVPIIIWGALSDSTVQSLGLPLWAIDEKLVGVVALAVMLTLAALFRMLGWVKRSIAPSNEVLAGDSPRR